MIFFCYNHVLQKLQPCAPELHAVYTGDAHRRRGYKHEHTELQPAALYAGSTTLCASTTRDCNLLRAGFLEG